MLAGKYRIDRVLGEGGMGVVVAATHVELEQKVAIKFLLPDALRNAEVVSRFSREARAAARIRGEHVARVIDVGALETGAPYIVMEYLEGRDLAAILAAHGPLPVVDVVSYVLQACEALAEAHLAGIVHRDIKPANLFLAATADRSHIIKVLDFGISKSMDPNSASGSLTRTSAVLGSAFYLSPEQLVAAKTVDHRADIWALGIVLYQLLAGRVPFDGESMPEVVAHILKNQPIPLRQIRPDVPDPLAAIIAHCLREMPHERFGSVLELARALAPYGGEHARISVDKIGRVLGGAPTRDPSMGSRSPLAESLGNAIRPDLPIASDATNVPSVVTEPNAHAHAGPHAALDRTNMPWVAGSPTSASGSSRWLLPLHGALALMAAGGVVVALVFFLRTKAAGPASAASGSASTVMTVATAAVPTPPSATAIPEASAASSAASALAPATSTSSTTPPKVTATATASPTVTVATTPRHAPTTTATSNVAPSTSIEKVLGMQPKK
jgi:serine/threonine-protein kinase